MNELAHVYQAVGGILKDQRKELDAEIAQLNAELLALKDQETAARADGDAYVLRQVGKDIEAVQRAAQEAAARAVDLAAELFSCAAEVARNKASGE